MIAYLLAVTPMRHWLEYVDWAAPILEQPLDVVDGSALVPDRSGMGVVRNSEALERRRIAHFGNCQRRIARGRL